MKYLKLFEEFTYDNEVAQRETEEILLPEKCKEVYMDERGVYHIKNCKIY